MKVNLPENPFVGLRPFEANESILFFGRQKQIRDLLQQLYKTRFLAVIGSSGCGKSSLVRAGLIPSLQGGFLVNDLDNWIIINMKPGSGPISNFVSAFYTATGENADTGRLEQIIREEGITATLDYLEVYIEEHDANMLLLIDQFEEIFRFNQEENDKDHEDAGLFVTMILNLAEQRKLPIYVTLTMRSDFLGDCDLFLGLPEAMNQSQYLVPRLSRQQRREAIEGPVRLYQGQISPRLTDLLLNESVAQRDDLPILQHLLMQIWQNAHLSGDEILDISHYNQVGGLTKSLSNHADEALKEMDARALKLTERIFKSLTQIDQGNRGIRRPSRLSTLVSIARGSRLEIWNIIHMFSRDDRSFLISSSNNPEDDPIIDISHESLIRQWSQLKAWAIEEEQSSKTFKRLANSALLYKSKKAGHYRNPELGLALDWKKREEPNQAWAKKYNTNYNEAIEFLDKSRRLSKRKKTTSGVLIISLITILSALLIFSLQSYSKLKTANAQFINQLIPEINRNIVNLEYEKAVKSALFCMELNTDLEALINPVQELAYYFLESGSPEKADSLLSAFGEENNLNNVQLRSKIQELNPTNYQLLLTRYYPEMVLVPGGSYIMGSTELLDEKDKPENRLPHSVKVDSFYMAATETTGWQYYLYIKSTGREFLEWTGMGNMPAPAISWYDAIAYSNWLSDRIGYQNVYQFDHPLNNLEVLESAILEKYKLANWKANGFRLPTEAEWEYAARGGPNWEDQYRFSGSNDADEVSWNYDNSKNQRHPVSSKQPNQLGIYDLSGAVWEWCWDFFDSNYYEISPEVNPIGPKTGSTRVQRGGSKDYSTGVDAVFFRYHFDPTNRIDYQGFRVVRKVE